MQLPTVQVNRTLFLRPHRFTQCNSTHERITSAGAVWTLTSALVEILLQKTRWHSQNSMGLNFVHQEFGVHTSERWLESLSRWLRCDTPISWQRESRGYRTCPTWGTTMLRCTWSYRETHCVLVAMNRIPFSSTMWVNEVIPRKGLKCLWRTLAPCQTLYNPMNRPAQCWRLFGIPAGLGRSCCCSLFSQVPKDFAFTLYDLDWDVFTFNIEGAINRVPAIETTGVKSTVCGPGELFFFYRLCSLKRHKRHFLLLRPSTLFLLRFSLIQFICASICWLLCFQRKGTASFKSR